MTGKFELPMNEYLPLRDVVFMAIREAILSGKLEPGERLMEIHLARELGVSRTPVREAIRMLELEGLVNMIPRRGAVVAEITPTDMEDVLEVRAALEQLAVRKACSSMTQEQLQDLKNAARVFADCLRKDDLKASAQADVEFHEIISSATGNRRLIQILNNLREQMYRYRLEQLKDKKTYADLVREHAEICKALEERSEEKASAAIHVHIDHQKESIMETLRKKHSENKD